jgi:signal transduction histidine kinase
MEPALASARRAMDGLTCLPPQGLRRQALDLSALARQIMDELREAEPLRQVRVYIEPELMVQGDPALLHQALQGLLGNAWKFTRQQSQASIFMGAEHATDGQIHYVVRDNGIGFDMATAAQALEGSGMATVQDVVARHGGQISAKAKPGQGAMFRFSLAPAPQVMQFYRPGTA